MTRHQAFVFRKIRNGHGHHHCCVNGRSQVLHQTLVTQPQSNEPQSDMLLCKMKRGHGLLLLADVRVHHECHSRRFLASAAHDLLLFCLPEEFVQHLARKRDVARFGQAALAQHLLRRAANIQTLIQSVHDPPIFGYSRFSYWMHERLQ